MCKIRHSVTATTWLPVMPVCSDFRS